MFTYQLGSLTQMMAMTNCFSQTDFDKAMMNLPFTLHLKGNMNFQRLENSIKKVLDSKIMHTYLSVEGMDIFAHEKDGYSFSLELEEAKGESVEERVEYVSNFAKAKALEPLPLFDGTKDQYYFRLFKVSEEYHILLMIVHHTFLDFGAVMIAISSIFRCYEDDKFKIPESSDFSKFMTEELEFFQTDGAKKEDDFWNKELENVNRIELPISTIDPNAKPLTEEDFCAIVSRKELENIATKNKTSVFNVSMLMINMAIAKANDTNDVLSQYAISNRSDVEYRFTLGCLTRILNSRVQFNDNMNVSELNKYIRKKIGEGYQNRHVAGKTPLGAVPYVIANEDMSDLEVTPTFNGNAIPMDFVDIPRNLTFFGILIIPAGGDNLCVNILTDVNKYSKHALDVLENVKLAYQFLVKYPNRTFEDFMRKDISLNTLNLLDSDDDVEIIEI